MIFQVNVDLISKVNDKTLLYQDCIHNNPVNKKNLMEIANGNGTSSRTHVHAF